MYQHPDDNYQPQHPHLQFEFEHSEGIWSSIKSAAGKVGGAVSRGAKKVGAAAGRAKRAAKRKIFRAGLSKEDKKKFDAEDPDKVDKEISKAQKKGNDSDDDDSGDEEEEEAYWSDDDSDEEGEEMVDEEYKPMHPHLQGDFFFEPSAWPGRRKKKGSGKISKKSAIKKVAKSELVRVWYAMYDEQANSKYVEQGGKVKRVFIDGGKDRLMSMKDYYQKCEGIAMSNAYFPVICEKYLSMKGAKFDRNSTGSSFAKSGRRKKLATAIVETLTKPEYKGGTAGVDKKLPEKYVGAPNVNNGYQKIYSPNKKMSGYAHTKGKRPWGKYGKTNDDVAGKRLNTRTLKLVKIEVSMGKTREPLDYTTKIKNWWKEVYDILDKIIN